MDLGKCGSTSDCTSKGNVEGCVYKDGSCYKYDVAEKVCFKMI